jgi:hypothetical protein
MRKSDNPTSRDYDDYVASALSTEGGHLSIGRGAFTLYFAHGARLSRYDCEQVKACCIAAGLPVIDSRLVGFEDLVRLAVCGPMAAVGEEASPPAYHALSYARFPCWRTPIAQPEPRCSISPSRLGRRRRKSERRVWVP